MEKLTLPAKLENYEQMISFIVNGAEAAGFDKATISKIHLACEEALVNVINYAYPDKQGDIEIGYNFSDDNSGFLIDIIDWGIEFNPLNKSEPDIEAPLDERPIGGLGIFFIRKIMDEVIYKRDRGRNILTLIKR